MIKKNVSVVLFLNTRHKKKDGTYAIKIRVRRGKAKEYSLNVFATEGDYKKITGARPKGNFIHTRKYIDQEVARARDICNELNPFSFELFEDQFLDKTKESDSLVEEFNLKIQSLLKDKKFSTAEKYQTAINSLLSFSGKDDLRFWDITPRFLKSYEAWMLKRKRSYTTISINLRQVRTVFNIAIDKKKIRPDLKPFGKKRFKIKSSPNNKKAVTIEEIRKIANFQFDDPHTVQEFYRDMFIFCFLCNGMNPVDICLLQHSDIKSEYFEYYRKKTITTKQAPKKIKVQLSKRIKHIIEKWGTKKGYVFRVFDKSMTEKKRHTKRKYFNRKINEVVQAICEQVGINEKLTTYWARHSAATILRNSGMTTEQISEFFGHSDVTVTQRYLDSIDDAHYKEASNILDNLD